MLNKLNVTSKDSVNLLFSLTSILALSTACVSNQETIKTIQENDQIITSETNQKNSQIFTAKSSKETVSNFLRAVKNNDPSTIRKLANTDYIQHNPYVPTGLDAFISMLQVLQQNQTKLENIRMFQDGNYFFLHNIWRNAKPFGADRMVAFHILRVDDKGMIAEHWNTMTTWVEKTASGRTQIDGPIFSEDLNKTETNKKIVMGFLEDVLMGQHPENITKYVSDKEYHQHNPMIKDGLQGIYEAVKFLTSQNNMSRYTKIHKLLGEGNFILSISEGNWNKKQHVFYDLFRVKDNKLVEHWDVIQEIPTQNLANKNTMFNFK
ncbi:nuclear transport factor 2 family protein [Pigmentibacter ruber]